MQEICSQSSWAPFSVPRYYSLKKPRCFCVSHFFFSGSLPLKMQTPESSPSVLCSLPFAAKFFTLPSLLVPPTSRKQPQGIANFISLSQEKGFLTSQRQTSSAGWQLWRWPPCIQGWASLRVCGTMSPGEILHSCLDTTTGYLIYNP